MKYSLFSSLELELEEAISEMTPPETLPVLVLPDPPLVTPVDKLTKMSYLLKFSPGGYYSHLTADNRYS
jgi:hypothetical protein